MQGEKVYEVSELNQYIKNILESVPQLDNLLIRGELSNYKIYPSGHHYFTLKDAQGTLRCVMFKGSAMKLKFRPENGMKVVAMGRITVFPRDGAYQLYCTGMIPDGVGDLYIAFEQLKKKLQEQGLFDPAHKKPIPKYPDHICISSDIRYIVCGHWSYRLECSLGGTSCGTYHRRNPPLKQHQRHAH